MRLYGTNAANLLNDAQNIDDLGQHFGAGLHEIEVRYLYANEWAVDAEDILFRRTKLGIRLSVEERQLLADYLSAQGLKSSHQISS